MEKSPYFSLCEKVKNLGNFTFHTLEKYIYHFVKFTEIFRIFHHFVKIAKNEISLFEKRF